jgi:ATP-dependent Clp protease ATP-binding subunit ClpA/ActR/RegA family two-component response regulator
MSGATPWRGEDLVKQLAARVVGQTHAFLQIVPFVEMHLAGLGPEGRPVGVFLLLGPTGTGKTRTVEALAEVLHGSSKQYLRIDCGEYQLDHEVARLVGAPPGYLGHRETRPVLSQEALLGVVTPQCDMPLVLFDEIEKAAPALTRMLLGVLDKARLQMGDNTQVDFEKCLIFLTSNLGAKDMMREMQPTFGFEAGSARAVADLPAKLEAIAMTAVKKQFSPEFINRIDAVLTYQPLGDAQMVQILELQLEEMRQHIRNKLGTRAFQVELTEPAKAFLLRYGTSAQFGARELKRVLYRNVTQPLATLVAQSRVPAGGVLLVDVDETGNGLSMHTQEEIRDESRAAQRNPLVLIVDDNRDLLRFLARVIEDTGWEIVTAESAEEANLKTSMRRVDVALLDYMLPDQNGLSLGLTIKERFPEAQILIMSGGRISLHEEEICQHKGFPVIQKPFLMEEILEPLRRGVNNRNKAARTAH